EVSSRSNRSSRSKGEISLIQRADKATLYYFFQYRSIAKLQAFRRDAVLFPNCLLNARYQSFARRNLRNLSHLLADIIVIGDAGFFGIGHLQIFLNRPNAKGSIGLDGSHAFEN